MSEQRGEHPKACALVNDAVQAGIGETARFPGNGVTLAHRPVRNQIATPAPPVIGRCQTAAP